jgi:hypothetical protein
LTETFRTRFFPAATDLLSALDRAAPLAAAVLLAAGVEIRPILDMLANVERVPFPSVASQISAAS